MASILRYEMHGMKKSPEYRVWARMIQRCYDKNYPKYYRYGGRKIIVCEKWRNSFLAFYTDMGPKPFPKAQIDRINNDGNYEPGNVRWATRSEQALNRRKRISKLEKWKEIIQYFFSSGGYSYRQLGRMFGTDKATIKRLIYE